MKGLAIYVEGGGDTAQQKSELRSGFDRLLGLQKQAAREKKLKWKLVPAGGRNATYDAFMNAVETGDSDTLFILLVDSENAVSEDQHQEDSEICKRFLTQNYQWDLSQVKGDQIHLMVQCMETWIVADPDAVASFYGNGFRKKRLPVRPNLEEEPKAQLLESLAVATRDSQKGTYGKIRHASKLLEIINPTIVESRCSQFAIFSSWLSEQITKA